MSGKMFSPQLLTQKWKSSPLVFCFSFAFDFPKCNGSTFPIPAKSGALKRIGRKRWKSSNKRCLGSPFPICWPLGEDKNPTYVSFTLHFFVHNHSFFSSSVREIFIMHQLVFSFTSHSHNPLAIVVLSSTMHLNKHIRLICNANKTHSWLP